MDDERNDERSDERRQRRLERALLRISEAERRRIGRDLHDGLGSLLTGIAMLSQGLARAARDGRPAPPERLEEIARLAAEGIEKTRVLARGLNPVGIDEKSLRDALEQLAADTWTVSRIPCRLHAGDALPELDEDTRFHLYRIAQEAVTNAARHARPGHILIRLTPRAGSLVLSVEDDGAGFPDDAEPARGMGLHTMQHRADLLGARLELSRGAEGGTIVRCTCPLPRPSS